MKKSLKKLTALGLTVAMTASLAACGSGGSEKGGTNEKEHVELTGMVQQSRWYSGLQAMVEKLEEDENISIEFEVIPDDQYDNLMKMRLNSHEAPDLVAYQFADLFAAVNPEEFFVALDDEPWMDKVATPEMTEYNGKTPMEYVTERKMEEGKRLLRQGNMRVKEVAEQLGYEDSLYFSKVFKRMEGISPKEYSRRGK